MNYSEKRETSQMLALHLRMYDCMRRSKNTQFIELRKSKTRTWSTHAKNSPKPVLCATWYVQAIELGTMCNLLDPRS